METEQKLQYFDLHSYGRQRCVFLVLLMLNRRPRGPLHWVLAFFTASYQHLLWTPFQSGAPSPFGLVWLSLPHLVYNSVWSLTVTVLTSVFTELYNSSTSTQSPTCFWNCMFDRHQAEITVMQFTLFRCISLWVYHGNFFTSSHFVSQFPPTWFPLITAIRMCHFLSVHHLGMAFLAGSKVKIQHKVDLCKKIHKIFPYIWFVTFFHKNSR